MVPIFYRFTESPTAKLDAKDWRILSCLCQDARMQAADIGIKVQLSRDTVGYRIRRLQATGVIQGFVPIIHRAAFGLTTYRIFLLLHEKEHSRHQLLLNHLTHHANTLSVMLYTDTWDAEWVLVAKDLLEADLFVAELLRKYDSVILRKEIIPVLQEHLSRSFPSKEVNSKPAIQALHPSMDETDNKLLYLLCENSRQSSYDLCGRLECSPDTASRRIKGLLQRGVVTGFKPVINMAALGRDLYTYAVTFATPEQDSKIAEFVAGQPSIIRAVKTFGQWNLLLTIAPQTRQEYHELVKNIKNAFAETIHDYQTWLAHKELVFRPVPMVIFSRTLTK